MYAKIVCFSYKVPVSDQTETGQIGKRQGEVSVCTHCSLGV